MRLDRAGDIHELGEGARPVVRGGPRGDCPFPYRALVAIPQEAVPSYSDTVPGAVQSFGGLSPESQEVEPRIA